MLGWSFYSLFERVSRTQARLLLVLVLLSAAIGTVDVVLLSAPLVLQCRAAWFGGISNTELDTLGLVFLQIRSFEVRADEMLWGLWPVPLGLLSIRSGFIPKPVGWAVLVAACGWVMQSVGYLVLPAYQPVTDRLGNMLAQLELIMIFWLIGKGALRQSDAPPLPSPARRPG